jgi:cytochrome c2
VEKKPSARWPLYVAFILLAAFVLVFLIEFIGASENPTIVALEPAATLAADTYLDQVSPLLQDADPQNGDALLTQFGCVACHRAGAENGVAPSFVGIAERAAGRRPPLTAAAYIYESVMHPSAYVVEGYSGAMLQDYPTRLSDRQLGDIIAYLLTPDAK